MGAWSHEAFGNDDACDWAAGLEEVDDLSLVEAALTAVAQGGYLDASDAMEALAAIEVIARLRGHPGYSNAYTEAADDWVAAIRLTPPDALVQRALGALERIGGDQSELKELWDDSDSADDWQASLADLRQRLQAPPQPLPAPLDETAKVVRSVVGIPFVLPASSRTTHSPTCRSRRSSALCWPRRPWANHPSCERASRASGAPSRPVAS